MARPSKYKKEYCEKLIEHIASGLSFESFAGVVSVTRDCLYKWTEKYPEFLYSKRIAEAKGLLFWEKIGRAGTLGQLDKITGKSGGKFNHISWIFLMKNRFGWRDHVQVSESNSGEVKKIEVSYKVD